MKERGFSVVEILVVVIVMTILLTLAVVNVRSSQANARDAERTSDVENTALRLETFYNTSAPVGGGSRYPGTSTINKSSLQTLLPGFDFANMRAPGNDNEATINLVPATNTNETPAGVAPQPSIDTYVYQAINTDGTLCTDHTSQTCRRFNIFYRSEVDNTVQIKKSKNR